MNNSPDGAVILEVIVVITLRITQRERYTVPPALGRHHPGLCRTSGRGCSLYPEAQLPKYDSMVGTPRDAG